MADFETRVEGLTQLTMGTDPAPSTSELTEFLKDGVLDVTNRWLAMRPQDIELFGRESSETTSNASLNLNGARIISVIREDGTNNQWRKCRKISSAFQYDVTDVDSLNYSSKINPAYMIGDTGKISVFPTPGADPDAFKAYYVNKDPVNSSGSALAHSHDDILYFPIDKVYLVVLYASMRSLHAAMGATTITDLTITAVPPDTPLAPSFTAAGVTTITARAISATAPAYTKPSFTAPTVGGSADELTDITALDSENTIDDFDGNSIEVDQWFATAAHLIEDEEDIELAGAQIQKINSYIGAYQAELGRRLQTYQADIQNELNEFNKENVAYQQDVQEALAEMQVAAAEAQKEADFTQQTPIQEYANKLQKYQNEIAAYQADVATEVQEYTQNLQADGVGYQWLQGQYAALKAEYDAAFMIAAPKQQAPARR